MASPVNVAKKDIISLVDYLIQHNQKVDNVTLCELCNRFSDNPKSMEQRIRRTANMGMVNLANLGLEDYANDTFTTYSNSLYNFEQVRREMDFIRGKSVRHGNVKIKNFLNALIQGMHRESLIFRFSPASYFISLYIFSIIHYHL